MSTFLMSRTPRARGRRFSGAHAALLTLVGLFGAGCGGDDGPSGSPSGGAGGSAGNGGSGATAGSTSGGSANGGSAGSATGGSAGTAGSASGGSAGGIAVDHFVYTSGESDTDIQGFRFNPDDGSLTSIGRFAAGQRPTYLAYRPGGRFIYVANEAGSGGGRVRAYSVAPGTGELTELSTRESGGDGAVHVSVHPSGNWLLVSNYNGGNVRVFPLAANGDLGEPSDTQPSGANSHQILLDPAGRFASVPCRGPNYTAQFAFDDTTGSLTPLSPPTVGSDDPRHIAYHPSGNYAYLLNEDPANVVSYEYDSLTGALGSPEKLDLATGENWGSHIVVTPDGRFVFAGGRRTSSIYSYAVNPASGRLTPGAVTSATLGEPRNFSLSPSGEHLVVANQNLGTLSVFRVGDSGDLSLLGTGADTVSRPQAVIVVPVPAQ